MIERATHERLGENAVALVTGAAHGLGLEVARHLALRGLHVLISARDPEAAKRAAERATNIEAAGDLRALELALDIADERSVRLAVGALGRSPGRIDVLVNNAAAYVDWSETASGADLAEAERVLETNLFGAWRLTQALLPLLRRSAHPRIVNVSSGAGSHGDQKFGLTAAGAEPPRMASAKRP